MKKQLFLGLALLGTLVCSNLKAMHRREVLQATPGVADNLNVSVRDIKKALLVNKAMQTNPNITYYWPRYRRILRATLHRYIK